MPTITVEAQLSPSELIRAVEQLEPADLNAFTTQVLALRAQRIAPTLPAAEAELLRKINAGVPSDIQTRLDTLRSQKDQSPLTAEEYAELLTLTEQIERVDADRLEHLATLSQMRQIPLRQLMEQLGLKPHSYGR